MGRESWRVPPEADGLRADAFLRLTLPELPESVLRRIFAARDARLDGRRVGRETPVAAGADFSVYLPEAARAESLSIVYEDEDVLLVNKRAGLCVEADGPGVSLTALCRHHEAAAEDAAFPAPCHRLDNQTCGLCLFAKNQAAMEVLTDVFRNRTLEKRYECLVRGQMKPPAAVCRAWLIKDAEQGRVRISDHPCPGAKPILTGYETLEAGPVSRLSVDLITGRTHQIRAHLAALGHPILGDDLYGDRGLNRERRVRSLRLCAVSLKLDTGGRLPALDGREFRISPPF